MVVYEIIVDIIRILNLVALTQVNFQKEIGNIDLQKIYQPVNKNVVYGNKLKALRVETLLTMDEAKTYCKNAKADIFFVNTEAPFLDELFTKFQLTEIWDSSYYSARYKLVLTEDGSTLAQSSGDKRIEIDPGVLSITADKCVSIKKGDDKFRYMVSDCTAKKSVVCMTKSPYSEQTSTISNLSVVQKETKEIMLIFTKIQEQSFVRIKKLYEMNNQFKNTDIEIAESVDLNEPLEKQIIFLENINRNWLNTFKRIDHPFDVNLVQADLSASLKIVSDILQTLYLVLDQPEAFLSNYTPNYEVDKFFRDANCLLIFSTQILKPENNEIEIPSDNLFNLLEKRPSVYDIGLSSFLILTIGLQILLAYYKKIKGKKVQKPIVRQMQLKRK